MTITHTHQYVITDGSMRLTSTDSIASTAGVQLDESIPDGSTDMLVNVTIESTSLKAFALLSTQDVTVKTNSSGSPQETITLQAKKPRIWTESEPNVPIAGDVTAFYVTNSSGSAATLSLLAGWDATP